VAVFLCLCFVCVSVFFCGEYVSVVFVCVCVCVCVFVSLGVCPHLLQFSITQVQHGLGYLSYGMFSPWKHRTTNQSTTKLQWKPDKPTNQDQATIETQQTVQSGPSYPGGPTHNRINDSLK
jgi:hypothetical protein